MNNFFDCLVDILAVLASLVGVILVLGIAVNLFL